MQIGRKIYYDKNTGNVILDTKEWYGDVQATTFAQDYNTYSELKIRTEDSIGVIQLAYGELIDKFSHCTGFHVDITKDPVDTKAIIFSFRDVNANLDQIKESQISEIKKDCNKEILAGFNSKAKDGATELHYDFSLDDQINMSGIQNKIIASTVLNGSFTGVIEWKNSKQTVCDNDWSVKQFTVLCEDAENFKTERIKKCHVLQQMVQSAEMRTEVEKITWDTVVSTASTT